MDQKVISYWARLLIWKIAHNSSQLNKATKEVLKIINNTFSKVKEIGLAVLALSLKKKKLKALYRF